SIAGEWAAPPPPSQFLEYWHVMRGNLAWITLVAVAGTGLGWLAATLRPSIYQARTVLDIRSLNENFLNPREGSPIGTTGSVLPESYIQTEIKILSSDSLRKRALGRLAGLQHPAPVQQSDPPSWWRSLFGKFEPGSVAFKTLAADAANRVKVRAVGNTRIVEVLCDARDGQLAADICNNLARTYIEYNLESRYQSTKETGDWLQSQLDDVKRRLTKAENELKDSSKETAFLFDADSADNPAQDKLRQLQNELSRTQSERINRESDYEIASSRSADSLPLALDAGPIREYRMRLAELKRQQAELGSTMTPEHYKVRELNMQIGEVEKALKKERDDLINRLKADYESAQRRESVFAGAYEKQAGLVSEHADKAVGYNMLKREVDSDRKLYETLLQKVDEVGLAAALHTSTISVVDPAAAPAHPYSPNVLANLGIGFFGGSVLGLAFALLRLRSDRTLHGPGEASLHLRLRELGVIPSVRNRRLRTLLNRIGSSPGTLSLSSLALGDAALAERQAIASPRSFPSSMALATWLKIPELAEAFFGTMSSLRFATERGEQANVIVLTSPDAGEGKTTVATNLAIALAQIGRRVILVDGDLRKPSLDQIFGMSCEGGLAELLEMDGPIEQANLSEFLFHSPIPNLDVLPTKAAHEGICTKLHSARMRVLLERLRREYDNVIIDTPPMLHIADARVLGWLADGVLLVLRARKTTKDAALATYDCLLQDGINVFGTVLNDWNPGKNEKYSAYKSYLNVN
ncbi:MAG: polysaccharide biosynthesis tyrosine autokinase, partial [Acidobacteriota bacterium]|nr:polysaccharide biosynthesis tyrosine autokinase [Acidobacteriota bacterium]